MPQQSKDGQAHITFYDKEYALSFVWDGVTLYAEISHGGYGEPVVGFLYLPRYLSELRSIDDVLESFERVCRDYILANRERFKP